VKTFWTNRAIGLATHGPCLPRLTRVDVPPSLRSPWRHTTLFDHDSLAIMDFETSIKHDVGLLRASPAVPKHSKIYGFFYEISSGKLTEVTRDIPA
jgi:carbonic anhydrase